jgi:outer membrane lipoprotein-sorting protein
VRQEQTLPFGKVIVFSDGKTGWIGTPQGVQEMPGEVLKQMQGEILRQLPAIFLADLMAGVTVNAVSDTAVEISGNGQSFRFEFDAATGLPAKMTYLDGGMEATEAYSDWREVGGIKLPFVSKLDAGPLTVSEYKFNTGLKVEDLGKRP